MRNRALYGALRDFALEAAALLTDELRAGAEVEFDVIDQGGGAARRSTSTSRAPRRSSPSAGRACARCPPARRGAPGARRRRPPWLRVGGAGISGEQAEPALRAMLERLYEDATSFGFPEERFERVYREVEATLYRDALRAAVVAPLRGRGHRGRARSSWATAWRWCAGSAPTRPPRRSGPRTATASRRCSACSSAT